MKCTITKAAIWTRVIDEKGELVAYFTNPKHASFFVEALKILPPEPPEWPKEGGRYIWDMDDSKCIDMVKVNKIINKDGAWIIKFCFADQATGSECTAEEFQEHCKDYYEWKKSKEAQQ